jgi:RimJ/RimL family protein N-acetyltransferase
VDIGYTWLAASAQRTGINVEAKRLMLAHAFDTWSVRRVSLDTDVRNHQSARPSRPWAPGSRA